MITILIKMELQRLKEEKTIQEISDTTGLVYLTVWRKLNSQSPIDLDFIEVLENSGLIKPFDNLANAIV